MPRSEVCTICGEPRVEGQALARCEEHLREYWRNGNAKKRARKDEPRQAMPEPAPAEELPAAIVVQPPATGRITVRVTGERVEMDIDTFRRLLRTPAPIAQEPSTSRQFAVVSSDLSQVLLCDATPRELHGLDEDRYAHQLQALREAGWNVCVEG